MDSPLKLFEEDNKRKLSGESEFLATSFWSFYKDIKSEENLFFSSSLGESPIIRKGFSSEASLSDISITTEGFVKENWKRTTNIPARIIEATDDSIVLECLLENAVEEWVFTKETLENINDLFQGKLILIQKFERGGKISFEFSDGEGIISSKQFEFSFSNDLKNSNLFKPAK